MVMLGLALSLLCILLFVLLSKPRMYRYAVDHGCLVVTVARLFDVRVPCREITGVEIARFGGMGRVGPFPLLLKNRFSSEVLIVRKRAGIFRVMMLTPDDPVEFKARIELARAFECK